MTNAKRVRRSGRRDESTPRGGGGRAHRSQSFAIPELHSPSPAVGALARERLQIRSEVIAAFEAKARAVGLTEDRLRDVGRRLLVFRVAAGQPIQAPGELPDFLSVVGQGCVKTVAFANAADITVQFAKPSHFVGLAPVVPKAGAGHFGAVAHIDSVVAYAGHDLMRDILGSATPVQRLGVFAYHARALSRMIHDKTVLLTLGTKDRLMHELDQLQRAFPASGSARMIALPLSHQDLSALVGASREHVTRSIAQLLNEGCLRLENQRYAVCESALGSRHRSAPLLPAVGARAGHPPAAGTITIAGSATRLSLPKRAADRLMKGAALQTYEPGERIADTSAMEVSMLVQGAAHVMIDAPAGPSAVWVARPWQFIATGAVGPGSAHPRAFWVTALTRSVVATFDVPTMSNVLGMLSPAQLITFLGYCHAALSRQLYARCAMLTLGGTERLLYQLHILAHDFPKPARDGLAIDLPLRPRRDLPPLVAMAPSAVVAALNDLQSAGLVSFGRAGGIVVRGLHRRTGELQ